MENKINRIDSLPVCPLLSITSTHDSDQTSSQRFRLSVPRAANTPPVSEIEFAKPEYHLFHNSTISPSLIREVKPYLHSFHTFAKGRWLGKELLEVLNLEFGGFPIEYWKNAISSGFVTVNHEIVDEKYIIKNQDKLYHRSHRYVVCAPLMFPTFWFCFTFFAFPRTDE
jgi:hypothetical protein